MFICLKVGVTLGEWLFRDDDYTPVEDKNKFIDKSIFGILKVLSNIKRQDALSKQRGVYTINPVVKLFFTILILIFVSLSKSVFYTEAVAACTLISLALLNIKDIKKIITLSLLLPGFTVVMLLPAMLMGNIKNSLLIVMKVFTTITLVNILSYSTKWNEITKALKLFFIPDVFIMVFDITIRYIYVLGEAAIEMLYALKLRSIGKNDKKYNSLSGILGNLFIKSKEMGDEVYSAMECRGFTGEYSSSVNFKLSFKDALYIFYNIGLVAVYFLI